jgi:hypothetical protein
MKYSGSIVSWTAGCAASTFGITDATAYAIAENASAPKTAATAASAIPRAGMPIPYSRRAATSSALEVARATIVVVSACAAMIVQAGSGA